MGCAQQSVVVRIRIRSLRQEKSLQHTTRKCVCIGLQMIQWMCSQDMAGGEMLTRKKGKILGGFYQKKSRLDGHRWGRKRPQIPRVFSPSVWRGEKFTMVFNFDRPMGGDT